MLESLPPFHFFDCGNSYCGEHQGMRYLIQVEKGEEKKSLRATIWPEPWCLEKTAPEKTETNSFEYNQDGVTQALQWLRERYTGSEEVWKKAWERPWSDSVKEYTEKKNENGED